MTKEQAIEKNIGLVKYTSLQNFLEHKTDITVEELMGAIARECIPKKKYRKKVRKKIAEGKWRKWTIKELLLNVAKGYLSKKEKVIHSDLDLLFDYSLKYSPEAYFSEDDVEALDDLWVDFLDSIILCDRIYVENNLNYVLLEVVGDLPIMENAALTTNNFKAIKPEGMIKNKKQLKKVI